MSVAQIDNITEYNEEQKIWQSVFKSNLNIAPDASLGQVIYDALQQDPDKIAQISATEQTQLSKRELLLNAIRIATYLRNAGIDQDDVVGIVARHTTHLSALVYALLFNGTAFQAISHAIEEERFQQHFAMTNPKMIFCDAQEYEMLARACPYAKIFIMKPDLLGVANIEELLQTPIDVENFRPVKLQHGNDQTMAILNTSGTTGLPKCVPVVHSHRTFDTLGIIDTDIMYTASTLDWISGTSMVIASAAYGITRIISEDPFDPNKFLALVQQYKITWVFLGSPHIAMIVDCVEFQPYKLDTIRQCCFGGGRITASIAKQMQSSLRHGSINFGYTTTELGALAFINFKMLEKLGSVGSLVGGHRAMIIDEQDCALGPGETGEICISNGRYWPGYIGNLAETQKLRYADGWLRTGDLGYLDTDHYLYIVDRKKDILTCKGRKYYPQEIEVVVSQMPNVLEVCAFGIWNKFDGDAPAVAVVIRRGTEITPAEVVEYAKAKDKAICNQLNGRVFIVDEFIKLPNGKVNRIAVKEACLQMLDKV